MIFVGPSLLSGIGQVTLKYSKLFPGGGATYCVLGQDRIPPNEDVFVYALPLEYWFKAIRILKAISKSVTCMTICETETVHEDYGKLFDLFDTVLVQSEFCKKVFSRQFPGTKFNIVHQYVPLNIVVHEIEFGIPKNKYIFYHIGNIADHRKNINAVIKAFTSCEFGYRAHLVLKATCNQPITLDHSNITIINGLIDHEEHLNQLHRQCNCYVSFSSSEGIGMGAVEAALHSKPVIITEYGGAIEYVHTPYTIKCGRQKIERDDFLFKAGMVWGDPSFDELVTFMKDAFSKKLTYMEHPHTKHIVSKENVLEQFKVHVIGQKNN